MQSFFRAAKPAPQPAPPAAAVDAPDAPSGPPRETTMVLDALGAVLQLYGKNAFDTDMASSAAIQSAMHAWMLHATMGAARPGDETARAVGGILYRDWKGLLHHFGSTRRDESAYVVRALGDMRTSIWAFVSVMHRLIVEEHEEGRMASEQFHRVRDAAASNSTEQLKKETLAAVSVMEHLLENRKERQRQQFTALAEKLKALGRELEDARREGSLDGLTRLPNRKSFDDYLSRCIELHSLLGQPASLMMVDVDNFKEINDTLGHPVGDEGLRHVARALSRTFLRRVDFVCRFGGDEFAVILQETPLDGAIALGEKLRRALRDVLLTQPGGEPQLSFTLSVGVTELALGDDSTSLVHRADSALYSAKRKGRDRVESAGHDAPTQSELPSAL